MEVTHFDDVSLLHVVVEVLKQLFTTLFLLITVPINVSDPIGEVTQEVSSHSIPLHPLHVLHLLLSRVLVDIQTGRTNTFVSV